MPDLMPSDPTPDMTEAANDAFEADLEHATTARSVRIWGPADHREIVSQNRRRHAEFWEQIPQALETGDHSLAISYASMGTLTTAVALAWVAKEFGAGRADELAGLMNHYAANGGDDAQLFTEHTPGSPGILEEFDEQDWGAGRLTHGTSGEQRR